jgi:ankyrin repeat protein
MNGQERYAIDRTNHIKDDSKRRRVQQFLEEMVGSLNAIGDDDDPELQRDGKYRDDGRDGVQPTTIEAIEIHEKDRIEQVRAALIDADDNTEDACTESDQVPVRIDDGLNRKGRFGYTPLHEAVVSEDIAGIKSLLARGADKMIRDNGDNTPFEKALKFELYEIAKLLQ